MFATQKIIIDTDPGQDDAVAILLALASPELEILGLTIVAGNVPLDLTARNAQQICALVGRGDLPIYKGCDRPMAQALVTAEHVHGKTGLDGISMPEPAGNLAPGHAVDFIIKTLRSAPAGAITLCPLGPLTNIATALRRAPDIAGRIGRIVLMGGAHFAGGNITPAAEFNIYVDPEAAAVVFGSGVPIVAMPLDVTHRALTSRAWIAEMGALGTPAGTAVASWTGFYERYDKEKFGHEGAPLHDPCVIAYLIAPGLFTGREVNVEIEVEGRYTRGMTVVDWWRVSGRKPNALFMHGVDRDGLFALLGARIARL